LPLNESRLVRLHGSITNDRSLLFTAIRKGSSSTGTFFHEIAISNGSHLLGLHGSIANHRSLLFTAIRKGGSSTGTFFHQIAI
jgi:predicted transcriptional regulator